MSTKRTRLLVADDHVMFAQGLESLLREEFDLLGTARNGEELVESAMRLAPDVILVDISMPVLNGFDAVRRITEQGSEARIIFLTMHDEVDLLHRAMDLGKGYILKESALVEIVNGIRTVMSGRPFVSPSMAAGLLERRSKTEEFQRGMPALSTLTPAERRILSMIAAGKPTRVIAAELHIHPRTVETHRGSICHKLQLNGANSLLRFALENKSTLLD